MTLLYDTAHAKINFFLHVTGRRDDGYHLIDSLAVFAGAADQLSLKKSFKNSQEMASLTIDGPYAKNLEKDDNLITKATSLLYTAAQKNGYKTENFFPISFHLNKALPIASGIGGGSADAACALRLLHQYWNLPLEIIQPIASQLGADVPVCLKQQPTRMKGIGDILSPIPSMPSMGMILANPGVSVSTPSIFQRMAQNTKIYQRPPLTLPEKGWNTIDDLTTFLKTTENDLQPHAIAQEPIIQTVLDTLEKLPNVRFSRMSGSGATCFSLFDSVKAAKDAYHTLSTNPITKDWWSWHGSVQ